MCGISGIWHRSNRNYRRHLRKMNETLSHRGPDGAGEYETEGLCLGHTRLSIVDLEGGKQPMTSKDNSCAVTFNGEIYGFERIKKEQNYEFRTHSDTELLLALYENQDVKMLERLPGMFSFSIWDAKRKRLFCARDRFGEKPFYYAWGANGEFIFSSEIKAILATGLVDGIVDESAVSHFLKKLYIHPHSSVYKNIKVLKPGHYLLVDESGVQEVRYWEFSERDNRVSISEAVEEVQMRLRRAVRDQLVADVPVGAFLSGGLDSSSIVSAASSECKELMTLSYRFKGEYDEGDYAKSVAAKFGTKHIEMFEGELSVTEALEKMAYIYDEPFADSSNIPTFQICEEARKYCKVVLTGDGADELFGGYSWKYRPFYFQSEIQDSKSSALVAGMLINKVLGKFTKIGGFSDKAIAYKQKFSGKSVRQAMAELYFMFSDAELNMLGLRSPDVLGGARLSSLNDVLKEDMSDYMAGDILTKTDRSSMANGLELRSPFLDPALVEYVMSLSGNFKVDRKSDKILLREAYGNQLPRKVRNRPKQGFGSPVAAWLSAPQMIDTLNYYFSPERRYSKFLDSTAVARYKFQKDMRTWALLVFSIWCETWEV
ncbi:asparagine synthase (glutamine-hydrolyzing) [Marinobacter halodurans]|uniref:asparagine synthase (glutamine-hydrolyzing) n=1 Tax=Marinobacter halodurans TaxID=2528979 RepID=A0ABY1ZIU6_9GAMM|nr:asparagine synthase (glutamine-hydrolyzing) [Marinobacter halodurans]TBW51588.1 asparagine synthase (glutamine-hydrolyzing) [Marinobacter halodurans]